MVGAFREILLQEAESHLDEATNVATVQISSFCFAKIRSSLEA